MPALVPALVPGPRPGVVVGVGCDDPTSIFQRFKSIVWLLLVARLFPPGSHAHTNPMKVATADTLRPYSIGGEAQCGGIGWIQPYNGLFLI